eukprot:18062-Heterococcus_DN1.PRE.1
MLIFSNSEYLGDCAQLQCTKAIFSTDHVGKKLVLAHHGAEQRCWHCLAPRRKHLRFCTSHQCELSKALPACASMQHKVSIRVARFKLCVGAPRQRRPHM